GMPRSVKKRSSRQGGFSASIGQRVPPPREPDLLGPRARAGPALLPLQVSDILATVDFFQGLLPALIVNITAFRIGLEGGCRPAPSA
ncbi:MAG: hypothetical protein Q8Q58_03080, partial [Candidatus Rokubacteria bacterium]|nr:hypothetical protein [Candidatus Rokubacteria bacterium]